MGNAAENELDGIGEIEKFAGIIWNRLAEDRVNWRSLGEAYVLQWTYRQTAMMIYY